MGLSQQTLAEEMYTFVAETEGIPRYKPQDIFKVMTERFKDSGISKRDCKAALKTLINDERLVYTVLNGSCTSMVCLPGHEEDGETQCTVPQ